MVWFLSYKPFVKSREHELLRDSRFGMASLICNRLLARIATPILAGTNLLPF
jgi:hypothetical protein